MKFCTKCGKQINADSTFCNNCGVKQGAEVGFKMPNVPMVLRPMLTNVGATGFGAIVLIVLLLQRSISFPILTALPNFMRDIPGLSSLMGWNSFYSLMNTARNYQHILRLLDASADDVSPLPFMIIFVLSLALMFFLAFYVYSMIKKRSNAQRIGRISYLLTFIFATFFIVSAFLGNRAASAELGIRVVQLRWTFYAIMVLAGIGFFRGFKKNKPTYNSSSYRQENTPQYRHFNCSNCKQGLRAPYGKGKIKIICSNCSKVFYETV